MRAQKIKGFLIFIIKSYWFWLCEFISVIFAFIAVCPFNGTKRVHKLRLYMEKNPNHIENTLMMFWTALPTYIFLSVIVYFLKFYQT